METLPHKSLKNTAVLLIANVVTNGLLVQAGIFTQEFRHFLGVKRRGEQAVLLEEFNSLLGLVIKLLSASLQNLKKSINQSIDLFFETSWTFDIASVRKVRVRIPGKFALSSHLLSS